ncbi:MAG TPA: AraC family transcriptional regulator [Thermoanaerobaculia bacterium]|nr:AraC family transcriptional regulator [Thermoanaerobaculia bacterium]
MVIRPEVFRRLCRARRALTEIPEETPSVAEVAREARISLFHFIRQFDAVFGSTPHQLRIEARLDRAKRLLAAGELSVTDVCMEVGFSSLGSFSELFTRRIGQSPSAFRRKARAMVSVPGRLPAELFPGCLALMSRLPPSAFRSFREA